MVVRWLEKWLAWPLATALLPGLLASAAPAQPHGPLGPAFLVNSQTSSTQFEATIAAAASGAFQVYWASRQDGSGFGVYGQRYDASGAPLGTEFRVNVHTQDDQQAPAVASAPDGSTVVVWTSENQDGSQRGIFARLYASNGTPLGGEFRVNTTTADNQGSPAVARGPSGAFVVTWTSDEQDGSYTGVFAQRYDASGVAQGGEFQVNTTTALLQEDSAVAMDPSGGFVLVWEGWDQDGSNNSVVGRRYDASGTPLGGEFLVNTFTENAQIQPSIAMLGNGEFLVVWGSWEQDGDSYGIYGQRFDASGTPVGAEFQISVHTEGSQIMPAAVVSPGGDYLVAWDSHSQEGALARRFDAAGTPQSDEFLLHADRSHSRPVLAAQPNDEFVAGWRGDGDPYEIYARRFAPLTTCGNGVIDALEECDDANSTTGDGCASNCQIESCTLCVGEPSACSCDILGCGPVCTCGDGVLDPGEQCDDGNELEDDGCSEYCHPESCFICSGEPSVCVCNVGYICAQPACFGNPIPCSDASGSCQCGP